MCRATISRSTREVGLGRTRHNRYPEAYGGAITYWRGNHSCFRAAQSVLEISRDEMRVPRDGVMVMTTPDVRRQLKIIAAVTGSTMKDVLARLVSTEMKRVAPASRNEVKGS